jgi:antitoxin (DNA-binding transcriptional repressor) of toxin-antitoxin stability system
MERVGIRELRASAAAAVRRAEGGQTTVITVGGRPVAQLGPLTSHGAERTIDELVAQGLLIAPRRARVSADASREGTIQVWGTVRLDRLLREVRG